MKVAVFSDIHGNLKALDKVLSQIQKENVDQIVFLGDIFQRGNEEFACLDKLMSTEIICVKGNCELYLQNGVDIDPDVEYLREYYDGKRKILTEEQKQFIKKMPLFYEMDICGRKLLFSHFLFSNIDSLYPFYQLADLKNGVFDKACKDEKIKKYDLVVVGHSHQNFVKANVVSVSAAGLEGATFVVIEVDENGVHFEHVNVI